MAYKPSQLVKDWPKISPKLFFHGQAGMLVDDHRKSEPEFAKFIKSVEAELGKLHSALKMLKDCNKAMPKIKKSADGEVDKLANLVAQLMALEGDIADLQAKLKKTPKDKELVKKFAAKTKEHASKNKLASVVHLGIRSMEKNLEGLLEEASGMTFAVGDFYTRFR